MPDIIRVSGSDGSHSCTFDCGDLPADAEIVASGHEPNGYFWEGMLQYLAPELADDLEFDSYGGMFAAYGDRSAVERAQQTLQPYLEDGQRTAGAIRAAEDAGFQFDD